jgi:hypothetical protein
MPRQPTTARLASPWALVLAAAALMLTNIPLVRYRSGGMPDYFWPALSVLLVLWQLWRRGRLAWLALILCLAATLVLYGLSVSGLINTGLPRWWILIAGAADILALAILFSPPIRDWVRKPPRSVGSGPLCSGRGRPASGEHGE